MKTNSILLLTKDAMCVDYLPCYGNQYWKGKTPNLDELAAKGTVYTRYYTAAPSSYMSYLAMSTGKFPHELNVAEYVELSEDYKDITLFDQARRLGYSCHILWDDSWQPGVAYGRCYGKETVFHPIVGLRQGVGPHYPHKGFLTPNEQLVESTLQQLRREIDAIDSLDESIFLWIHLPHVINGRVGFGGDIDVFDTVVGMMREYFSDDHIYISADHGNMNGQDGILGYGFHGRESEIKIPLITPRRNGLERCDSLMSNIDSYSILFEHKIPERDHVFSDTKYYAQDGRILSILKGKYKYMYYKDNGGEELFDLSWDPNEQFNLISDLYTDTDRNLRYPAREHYFYNAWEALPGVREEFRAIRESMWRDLTKKQKIKQKIRRKGSRILRSLRRVLSKLRR